MTDEVTIKLSRDMAKALAAQLDAMRENPEPAKICTKVVRPNRGMIGRSVCSRNRAFRAYCCLYPLCGVTTVVFSRFPEVWRGKGAIMPDAPLAAGSLWCPRLEVGTLYLPGRDEIYDCDRAFLSFDTPEEARTFYNEKILPTLEALARLADKTLVVDEETGEQDR